MEETTNSKSYLIGNGPAKYLLEINADPETIDRLWRTINPQIKRILTEAKQIKENPNEVRPCGCGG